MDDTDTITRLVRIETKLDNLIELHGDTRTRLGSVEKRSWVSIGGLGVVAFIMTKAKLTGFF